MHKALMDRTIEIKAPDNEFLIAFDVKKTGLRVKAVRVRLDQVELTDLDERFNVRLTSHPLYAQLERYVLANQAKK